MGSIADRMKALSGRGLDVGPSKEKPPARNRAASNASASSSDKQRPRGPSKPPPPLPTVADAPPRSRSNSKAASPTFTPLPKPSPAVQKLPPIPAPKAAALTMPDASGKEDEFEKAFPSLAEFGKQFDEDEVQQPGDGPSFPDVPSFDLPSVPTAPPRSAQPPSVRPEASSHDPPASLRPNPSPEPLRSKSSEPPRPQTSDLPVRANSHDPPASLRPNPPPNNERPPLPPKPKFPLTNAIVPEVLRSYIIAPQVEMLVLDLRSEEEYLKGYVGKEYESKGYTTNVVWVDPTILMRTE
jgi:ubiquitin carboxyl-terminal hydrolase 8